MMSTPILSAILLLTAGAAPIDAETEARVRAAEADPAGYRYVLITCAAYHGTVALQLGDRGADSSVEDAAAIKLIYAATLVDPDRDAGGIDSAYFDKLISLKGDLDDDADGSKHADWDRLGETCKAVAVFADASIASREAATP